MKAQTFWHVRSANYDKLFWTKDKTYIDKITSMGDFKKTEIVLDIGTGTGIMARALKPYVKHVVGLDISDSMISHGKWEGFSIVKWDIADSLFQNKLFDKLVARMVFHHILDNLDRVFIRCYDLLKKGGKLIVAEGIPPTEDKDVVDWYTYMFSFKEKRRVFIPSQLEYYFKKNGFIKVKKHIHITNNFSIRNWLENSGLSIKVVNKIMDIHINAPEKIKNVYNMTITKNDCFVDTKNIIIAGQV